MIVIDASALIEALVGRADPDLLAAVAGDIDAPHLLDIEVLSVLRGLVVDSKLDPHDAVRARQDHFAFTITRHEAAPLVERIWQLRRQFTSYLALAEALQAPLLTCDAKLATGGHNAEIYVIPHTHDMPR